MSSGESTAHVGRDEKGRFGPGNPGGPGRRPKSSPLHKAISDEKAESLWAARLVIAETDPDAARRDAAAEFILKYKNGTPHQAVPSLPEIDWPRITCVADLAHMVNAILGAQASGDLDAAGMGFLVDTTIKLAKVFEVVELGPEVRRLQEQVAALQAAKEGASA